MNEIMPPLLSLSPSLDTSESGSLPPSVGSGGGPFRFVTRQKICEADRLTGCFARITSLRVRTELEEILSIRRDSLVFRLAFLSVIKAGKLSWDISKRNEKERKTGEC